MNTIDYPRHQEPRGSITTAHIVYALHSLSILIGLMTGASIIGAFLFTWPSILAVILNYVMRGDAQGTFVESHFAWQIRTFWYAALYVCVILILGMLLAFIGVGIFLLLFGFIFLGIWVAYRIILGWINLKNNQPMPL